MKKILSVLGILGLAMLSGCLPMTGTEEGQQSSPWTMIIYLAVIVVFFVAMYFIAIRPERKREKQQKELLKNSPLYASMWAAHIGAKSRSVIRGKEVAKVV